MKNLLFILFFVTLTVFAQQPESYKLTLVALKDTSGIFLEQNRFMPNPTPEYKKSIRVGVITQGGQEYNCAIFNTDNKKYSIYSVLWVDKLKNGKNDYIEDHLDQMNVLFTLNGKSWKVTEVDSLGNYIKITECDSKLYPPIDVGFLAPNFDARTLDNDGLTLYNLKAKNKIVYFWGCTITFHMKEMKKVVDHFKQKDVEFICLSPNVGLDKKMINWKHIPLTGWDDPLRIKYQAGALPKFYVIDREQKIKFIFHELFSQSIIDNIEKIIE